MARNTAGWQHVALPNTEVRVLRVVGGIGLTLVLLASAVIGVLGIILYGDYSVQSNATNAAPDRIGGLVRTTTPALLQGEEKVLADLRENGLKKPFARLYEDPNRRDSPVLVAGNVQRFWFPSVALGSAFRTFEKTGARVADRRAVDPGAVGGQVECGTTTIQGSRGAVCAWADHGSVGFALFPNRSIEDVDDLVAEIRTATIVRS